MSQARGNGGSSPVPKKDNFFFSSIASHWIANGTPTYAGDPEYVYTNADRQERMHEWWKRTASDVITTGKKVVDWTVDSAGTIARVGASIVAAAPLGVVIGSVLQQSGTKVLGIPWKTIGTVISVASKTVLQASWKATTGLVSAVGKAGTAIINSSPFPALIKGAGTIALGLAAIGSVADVISISSDYYKWLFQGDTAARDRIHEGVPISNWTWKEFTQKASTGEAAREVGKYIWDTLTGSYTRHKIADERK